MSGVRTVTLTISSQCSSPLGHQPTLIQLSTGETWIPPHPLEFPPPGFEENPNNATGSSDVQQVANDLHSALQSAEQVRASGVGYVGEPGDPGPGEQGDTGRRQIAFVARDEVNIGVAKADGGSSPTVPQINLEVDVEPGDGSFDIKILRPNIVFGAHLRRNPRRLGGHLRGWATPPSRTPHETTPLKPGEGAEAATNRSAIRRYRWLRRLNSVTGAWEETREKEYIGSGRVRRHDSHPREYSAGDAFSRVLSPVGSGDLGVWTRGDMFGSLAHILAPIEALPVGPSAVSAYRYYATRHYYPDDIVGFRTHDRISLTHVGIRESLDSRRSGVLKTRGDGAATPSVGQRSLAPLPLIPEPGGPSPDAPFSLVRTDAHPLRTPSGLLLPSSPARAPAPPGEFNSERVTAP